MSGKQIVKVTKDFRKNNDEFSINDYFACFCDFSRNSSNMIDFSFTNGLKSIPRRCMYIKLYLTTNYEFSKFSADGKLSMCKILHIQNL